MGLTAGQPQPFVIRPAALSDLQDVLRIRQTQEVFEEGMPSTSADRLAAEWEALEPRLATHAWVAVAADGSLLACAELVRMEQVFCPRLWTPPDHRNSGLEMPLLARAEQQARAIGREEDMPTVQLFAQATSSYPAAQQALAQSGFVVTSTYEKMELALSEPPLAPEVISGIQIRPFAPEQDMEVVYRADEEAFQDQRGHTPRVFEQWRQRLNLHETTFDPSVWRIAWDADEIAGAALGEVVKRVGWIHHLFVRRPWRRRGLGAALTRSALDSFYQLGVGVVRLNVDARSLTNAHQLYRRVGFRVTGAYSNYEKVASLT